MKLSSTSSTYQIQKISNNSHNIKLKSFKNTCSNNNLSILTHSENSIQRRTERNLNLSIECLNRKKRRERMKHPWKYNKKRPKTKYEPVGTDGEYGKTAELNSKVTGLETGMAITWLGTSSGSPTRYRNVSSICLQMPEKLFLFDVGEGTQMQLIKANIYPGYIKKIFITHLHGDHCFGLPGLLNLISDVRLYFNRGEMLNIYGPPGLEQLMKMTLPYWYGKFRMPVTLTEFTFDEKQAHLPRPIDKNNNIFIERMAPTHSTGILEDDRTPPMSDKCFGVKLAMGIKLGYQWIIDCGDGLKITAAQLQHRIPCWGYVIKEDDYIPEDWQLDLWKKQREMNLEMSFDNNPESFDEIEFKGDDEHFRQKLSHSGRKVTILGDTCYSESLLQAAMDSDLLSHEATFARGMEEKAEIAQHSTAHMAGCFASKIKAKHLVLTHFSARYKKTSSSGNNYDYKKDIYQLITEAKKAFNSKNVTAAYDFYTFNVPIRKDYVMKYQNDDLDANSKEDQLSKNVE